MSDFTCPVPITDLRTQITLAHGEGGRLTRQFIRQRILSLFPNPYLRRLGDAASLPPLQGEPVMTTDGFVVSPLLFPGGDIGRLAVFGTTNDLAVSGARPRWLSLALIIEEGLPWEVLDTVLVSIQTAAAEVGVQVVTGDTKVVPRGAADQLFVTTTGLGERLPADDFGPEHVEVGDMLVVTGPVGCHGMAVLAAREGLQVEPIPVSDCASLWPAVELLWAAQVTPRALRDATRGGIGAVLHEWAEASGHSFVLDEAAIPVTPEVRGLCELLGIDPLHVANEGTMVLAVPRHAVAKTLEVLRAVAVSRQAAVIGCVEPRDVSPVMVRRALGRPQPLDEPLGAPLPRIC